MFLFVGATAVMAQDQAVKNSDAAVSTASNPSEKHECKPGCTMACCAGKSSAEKKSCSHEEKAKCAAHSAEAKKEDHESSPE